MARQEKLPAARKEAGAASPFDALHSQIDRLFSEFSNGFGFPRSLWDEELRMPAVWGSDKVMPSLELHETDGKVTVSAELPGVEEKDIEISVDDDMLTIAGEKKSEVEHKDGENYRSERTYGRFSRSVSLPFVIDPAKVDARFEKGVLRLSIDKPAEARPRTKKIAIKH